MTKKDDEFGDLFQEFLAQDCKDFKMELSKMELSKKEIKKINEKIEKKRKFREGNLLTDYLEKIGMEWLLDED